MPQEELQILYEDREILVCVKPPGVPVQSDRTGAYDLTSRLLNYLAASGSTAQVPYLAVIHRLDRPVGGVMVFAKTKKAAAELSRQVQERTMTKRYYCVLTGVKTDKERQQKEEPSEWENITGYLVADKQKNSSRMVELPQAGAKKAELRVRLLEWKETVLAEVELLTGRHHQIRVQMTCISEGIWGDTKYNSAFTGKKGWFELAFFSCHLAFTHPSNGKRMQFEALPEGDAFERFAYIQRLRER